MSSHTLEQWIEGCNDYEVCEKEEVEAPIDEQPLEEVPVEEPFSGTYLQFLAAPAVMALGSVVGIVEGAYNESLWAAAMGWGGFMFYFILVWFHEFIRGGPQEPDAIFDNYIGTSYLAFIVLGGFVVAQGFKTNRTNYPITLTTNGAATLFGFWMVSKISELNHSDDEEEVDELYAEQEAELQVDEANSDVEERAAEVRRANQGWF